MSNIVPWAQHDDVGELYKNQSNGGGDNGLWFVNTRCEFFYEQQNIATNGRSKRMPQLWKPLVFECKTWPLHPKPYIIELVPWNLWWNIYVNFSSMV